MQITPFLIVIAYSFTALSYANTLELNHRLQPDRDLTMTTVSESINNFRVIEDRGIVAKSNGRLGSRATTMHLVSTQDYRTVTGSEQTDGSFSAEIRFLGKATYLKGLGGREQLLPDTTPLTGIRVSAIVERGGKLRDGSVNLTGKDASVVELLKPMMQSVMLQAAAIEPIQLTLEKSVEQNVAMQLPIPGVANLSINLRSSNQLLGVENGVARVQQIYNMDFGSPPSEFKLTAQGSGHGMMFYDTATRILLSSEVGLLMKATFETADGVIETQINTSQTQKTRPSIRTSSNNTASERWVEFYRTGGGNPGSWDLEEIDLESIVTTGDVLNYQVRKKYSEGNTSMPLKMQVNCKNRTRGQFPDPSMRSTFKGTLGGEELQIACLAGARDFK
jgi:hypothetical protein